MGEAVEVWRGGVMPWECDAMGRLDVGFHAAKAMEALVGVAAAMGMPHAFAPRAEATLIVREQHIRLLREARAEARMSIEAGVLEIGEDDARVLLLMRHDDGELAASYQLLVTHATGREGRAFPWPERVRAFAERMRIDTPQEAAPLHGAASLERARALGLQRIGLGAVRPGDVDPFGRMRPEYAVARIAQDAPHLMWRLVAGVERLRERPTGAMQVEHRFLHLDWPRLGDRFELWGGLAGVEPDLHRMTFWFLNPDDGRPWAAAEGVGVCVDIGTRKSISLTEAELAPWTAARVSGLTI